MEQTISDKWRDKAIKQQDTLNKLFEDWKSNQTELGLLRLDIEAKARLLESSEIALEESHIREDTKQQTIKELVEALETQIDSCGMTNCGACNKAKQALQRAKGE